MNTDTVDTEVSQWERPDDYVPPRTAAEEAEEPPAAEEPEAPAAEEAMEAEDDEGPTTPSSQEDTEEIPSWPRSRPR